MPEQIDLHQVRYFLEMARTQLRNVHSKRGTNGKDSLQQNIEEALKEITRAAPQKATQESAVPAA